ncbi:hypothetical protein N8371_04030 [Vicingaceae bacterium]|nr:hypothetical protein [Vicingaceae bacterium]MDB4062188.1 hypothetical protein [Vicingaceae bacterium]MDC1451565.1 hypothetical protein [Vicingaceae bacterium]
MLVEEGFYWLTDVEETTEMYLTPNHNLKMSLDAELFDESLSFSGSLANENNYKAKKALWLESYRKYAIYSVCAVNDEAYFLHYSDSM